MKVIKKNQIIIYVIALMIMTAGYLNFTTEQAESSVETSLQIESRDDTQFADIGDATLVNSEAISEQETTQNMDEYFSKSKLERDTMYSQMIGNYEKILNSSNSLETQKQIATEEITKINNIKNCIMICENLIKTKGFDESIIFVNNESISVVIETEELKQEEIAQIQNIISRELKANIENIHISTK